MKNVHILIKNPKLNICDDSFREIQSDKINIFKSDIITDQWNIKITSEYLQGLKFIYYKVWRVKNVTNIFSEENKNVTFRKHYFILCITSKFFSLRIAVLKKKCYW